MNRSIFTRAAILTMVLSGIASTPVAAGDNYAEDRAQIQDLAARYLFALDFRDAKTYSETFTEDGILDYGTGEIKGRQAIFDLIQGMHDRAREAANNDTSGLRPSKGSHNISNMAIKVEGNRAKMVAYWYHHGNNNPERTASVTSYGHYEDELVKVNGEWLFSKRKIYNEQVDDWAADQAKGNPAW